MTCHSRRSGQVRTCAKPCSAAAWQTYVRASLNWRMGTSPASAASNGRAVPSTARCMSSASPCLLKAHRSLRSPRPNGRVTVHLLSTECSMLPSFASPPPSTATVLGGNGPSGHHATHVTGTEPVVGSGPGGGEAAHPAAAQATVAIDRRSQVRQTGGPLRPASGRGGSRLSAGFETTT